MRQPSNLLGWFWTPKNRGYLVNTFAIAKLKVSSKIVSGVKQSGIPDTIKMSEAAGH